MYPIKTDLHFFELCDVDYSLALSLILFYVEVFYTVAFLRFSLILRHNSEGNGGKSM